MKGLTDEEIKKARQIAIDEATVAIGEEVEVIDSFFEKAPHDAKPLWFLGKSFELLSTADVVYFGKGWSTARGCKMEHLAAKNYLEPEGVKVLEYQE